MPTQFYDMRTVITDQGRSLANIGIEAGFKIRLCTFKVGDGAPDEDSDPPTNLTELNNPVWPADPLGQPITAWQYVPNASGLLSVLELLLYIPPNDPSTGDPLEGFEMNEIGVYLENGVLFAVAYFPTLPKIGNFGVSIRMQLEIENCDSIFEFKDTIIELELIEAFTWLHVAGVIDQDIKGYLHEQIDVSRHVIEDLRADHEALLAHFNCEHHLNGHHKRYVVDRKGILNEAIEQLPGTGLSPDVNNHQIIYVDPILGDDGYDGLTVDTAKATLQRVLDTLEDSPGTTADIKLRGGLTNTEFGSFDDAGDGIRTNWFGKVVPSYKRVIPGTVVFANVATSGGNESFSDNGDGTLTGSQGGTGTVNYITGDVNITYANPVDAAEVIGWEIDVRFIYRVSKKVHAFRASDISISSYEDNLNTGLADKDFVEVFCDFNIEEYSSNLGFFKGAFESHATSFYFVGLTLVSPWRFRGADKITAPFGAVSGGGRIITILCNVRPHPKVSDSRSDTPTSSFFNPLLGAYNGGMIFLTASTKVFGLSSGQIGTGNQKKSLAIQLLSGGRVFAEDTEFEDVHRAIDNSLVSGFEGGSINVIPGGMTYSAVNGGAETTPRIGFDDHLTIRNVNADGTALVTALYA